MENAAQKQMPQSERDIFSNQMNQKSAPVCHYQINFLIVWRYNTHEKMFAALCSPLLFEKFVVFYYLTFSDKFQSVE